MRIDLKEVYVIIPALNEEKRIGKVILNLKKLGFEQIVVVDDGSTDDTQRAIPDLPGIAILSHVVNLGPGASTMTGIDYAIHKNAKFIATIDADHQHDPEDLVRLVQEMQTTEKGLVIGSRFMQKNTIPIIRRVYNKVGNWISYFKTGVLLSDSQSGLKVMSHHFAEQLYIDYNGFEFCIDIIKKARLNQIYIGEMPINVSYTKDTMSKGQSFKNGLMMLGRLLNPF